ncbi:MAG: hypothetical protein WC602_00345 [archaeon]
MIPVQQKTEHTPVSKSEQRIKVESSGADGKYRCYGLTKEEIKQLVTGRGLTITDLIDVVIELNGIIGVGLVTLGEQLDNHCRSKIRKGNDE